MLKINLYITICVLLLSVFWVGCSQESLPEQVGPEGATVQFALEEGISELDYDTELEPMSRTESSAPSYNNFILKNSELRIYRKINEQYILQQIESDNYVSYPQALGITTENKFNLSDFGLNDSYVLQPGEYRACLLLNGPYYIVTPQLIGTEAPNILQGPGTFIENNSMREGYFSYTDFEVKKMNELDTENPQIVQFPTLKCTAIPVRIMLETNAVINELSLNCTITSSDNSMPIGIDTEGKPIYDSGNSSASFEHLITLYKNTGFANIFFPFYGDSDKNYSTSVFIPIRSDEKSTSLNIKITEIKTEGIALPLQSPFEIDNVKVKKNEITNIILLYKNNELTNSTGNLQNIKKQWEEQYPGVPFDYLEYNIIP